MEAIELLGALAAQNPRLAGVLSAGLVVLTVIGLVCAQIDTKALAEAGYPRAAKAVELGAQIGAFAKALWSSKKKDGAT